MIRLFPDHIADEIWIDFVEQRLIPSQVAQVQEHLATGCQHCTEHLAVWRRLFVAFNENRDATPPDNVLHRAVSLFDTIELPRPILEQIMAVIIFDSRRNALPALARASTDVSYNLVAKVSDIDVSLSCVYDGNGWQVMGQVTPIDKFWSIKAIDDHAETETDLEEDGSFRLPNLAAGGYDLILTGAEQEVLIPAIQLG